MASLGDYTTALDFSRVPRRLTSIEVHDWVYENIHFKKNILLGLQIDYVAKQVFLTFKEGSYAEDIAAQYKGKLFYYQDKLLYSITIRVVNGTTRVKVMNLPMHLDDNKIVNALQQYGVVIDIEKEKWGGRVKFMGVSTGARLVLMKVESNIPSNLRIDGYNGLIFYADQLRTCYICQKQGHMGRDCPERTPRPINNVHRVISNYSLLASRLELLTEEGAATVPVNIEENPSVSIEEAVQEIKQDTPATTIENNTKNAEEVKQDGSPPDARISKEHNAISAQVVPEIKQEKYSRILTTIEEETENVLDVKVIKKCRYFQDVETSEDECVPVLETVQDLTQDLAQDNPKTDDVEAKPDCVYLHTLDLLESINEVKTMHSSNGEPSTSGLQKILPDSDSDTASVE